MFRKCIVGLFFVSSLAHAAELASATATYQKLPLERSFDGTIEAVNQATVSAETKGRVANLYFDVGDTVPAGAVILTLVSNEQRESLNQAEARYTEAKANFEVEQRDHERIDELYKRGIVSKSDWDRSLTRLNIAKSQVSTTEAAFRTAKEQLSYTEIHAPYGGVVSARHVELGEAVQPGTPLMSGFDPNAMRVNVVLPQSIVDKIKEHNKARIITNDGSVLTPLKIILYPIADTSTSTVQSRLTLPVTKSSLYPGEFVKVAFTTGEIERLLIPEKSVVYRSEITGVYVLKNNIPHFRQIRLGERFKNNIEVLAGLEQGEKVALDPVEAGIVLYHSRQGE